MKRKQEKVCARCGGPIDAKGFCLEARGWCEGATNKDMARTGKRAPLRIRKPNPVTKQTCSRCGSTYYVDTECPICQANPSAEIKPFAVRGKYATALITKDVGQKYVGKLLSMNGGYFKVDKQGRSYKLFLTLNGAKKWARETVKRFDKAAEGRNPGFFTTTRQRKPVDSLQFSVSRKKKAKGGADAFGVPNPESMSCANCPHASWQHARQGDPRLAQSRGRYHVGDCYVKGCRCVGYKSSAKNPGLFGPEAVAFAKRVTRVRRVRQKDTGELGEIVGSPGQGWLKVKWDNRQRPTLIKRSEIVAVRANGIISNFRQIRAHDNARIAEAERKGRLKGVEEMTQELLSDPFYRKHPDLRRAQLHYLNTRRKALAKPIKTPKWKNPSVSELAETFQGKASGAVSEYKAASSAPSDLARIGKLIFLKLRDVRKQIAAPGAMVAVDTRGRLWLASKRAPMFSSKAQAGTLSDYGEVERICYLTAKAHIGNGEQTEYVHSFGENGGARPHLLVDHEGMPILRGGDYKIRAEGIVN